MHITFNMNNPIIPSRADGNPLDIWTNNIQPISCVPTPNKYVATITIEPGLYNIHSDDIKRLIEQNVIYTNDNAGGTSKISEALSFEILRKLFGQNLVMNQTETNIEYMFECSGVVHVDYTCNFHDKNVIVSVTRITKYLQTINNPTYQVTHADIKRRIMHKFVGFSNVNNGRSRFVQESFQNNDIGEVTIQSMVRDFSDQINVLFIWVEPELLQMTREVLTDDDIVNKMREHQIVTVIVPTNSAYVMYEDPNMLTTNDYHADKIEKFNEHLRAIEKMRLKHARIRQYRAWNTIFGAVRYASYRIKTSYPLHNVLDDIKENGYSVIYKWVFRHIDDLTDPPDTTDGMFKSYFVSNLIYIDRYTQGMTHVDPSIKKSLIDLLQHYYSKKGGNFSIKYVKGSKINKLTGEKDLLGALVIVPADSEIVLDNFVFD